VGLVSGRGKVLRSKKKKKGTTEAEEGKRALERGKKKSKDVAMFLRTGGKKKNHSEYGKSNHNSEFDSSKCNFQLTRTSILLLPPGPGGCFWWGGWGGGGGVGLVWGGGGVGWGCGGGLG